MQTWLEAYIKMQIEWSGDFPARKYYLFATMQWGRTVQHG